MVGGSRHRVRPGGGSADDTEAATHGGSDDGGVAQLLQEDCPVKYSARWENFLFHYYHFPTSNLFFYKLLRRDGLSSLRYKIEVPAGIIFALQFSG